MSYSYAEIHQYFQKDHEELFWREVEDRFVSQRLQYCGGRPPQQVERKLVGSKYAPGERAAMAMFWGGLAIYRQAMEPQVDKDGEEIAQLGHWLDLFKKAAKARGRMQEKEKTTSHNLELFRRAWEDLHEISEQELGNLKPPLNQEIYSYFWSAAYYLWMAATFLKVSREYYPNETWTIGFQTDYEELDTPARGVDYDRLLFRSGVVAFSSIFEHPHLLPNQANGWLHVSSDQEGLLPLSEAIYFFSSHLEEFFWTTKAFRIELEHDCHIDVLAKQDEPFFSGCKQGVALISTPGGSFVEQFFLDFDGCLFEENIGILLPGNSWRCQPYRSKEIEREEHKRHFLRMRIANAIYEAHLHPSLQVPIDSLMQKQQRAVKKEPNRSGLKAPKGGNLLLG